jgi:hypothetical protein
LAALTLAALLSLTAAALSLNRDGQLPQSNGHCKNDDQYRDGDGASKPIP